MNYTNLDELINQHFNSYLHQSIILKVLDLHGNLKFITRYANKLMSAVNLEIPLNANYITSIQQLNYYSAHNLDKLQTTFNNVIRLKKRINYVMTLKTNSNNSDEIVSNTWYCLQIPLFDQNNEVIGVQLVCEFYTNIPLSNLLYNCDISYNVKDLQEINLTPRQHYILFLLCNNFTQEEIAAIFNVTRGTITRTIVDQLALKLEVEVANAYNVVAKAKKMGFQYYSPTDLFNDAIIIIDPPT